MSESEPFVIHCGAPEHGWIDFRVESGIEIRTLRVSYLTDALGDLVDAAYKLAQGYSSATFAWDGEPTLWRWKLTRSEELVDLRIEVYADQFADDNENVVPDTVWMRRQVRVDTFVAAVAGAAILLRDQIGEDGYVDGWQNNRFPSRTVRSLERTLAGYRTQQFFLGNDVDSVLTYVFTAPNTPSSQRECDIAVRLDSLIGNFTTTFRIEDIQAFNRQFGELVDHQTEEAALVSIDASVALTVTADAHGHVHVAGNLSHRSGGHLSFTIPIQHLALARENLKAIT